MPRKFLSDSGLWMAIRWDFAAQQLPPRPNRQTLGLPSAKRGGSGAAKSLIWQFMGHIRVYLWTPNRHPKIPHPPDVLARTSFRLIKVRQGALTGCR
jgi:hypothetical protein